MTTTLALVALVATLAVGVAVGLLYLQRSRKAWLVTTHLVLALVGFVLVGLLALAAPAGAASAALPLALLGSAVAAGYGALRIGRRGSAAGQAMLAGHMVAGIAGFLVFLAWIKALAGP